MRETREDKLPVWAQTKLDDLRQQVKSLELDKRMLQGKYAGTGVVTCLGTSSLGAGIALPDRSVIAFNKGQERIELLRDSDRVLRVYARGVLQVLPQAANSVYLKSK